MDSPEDYDWMSRDWYIKALEYDGLAYSDVFLDAIDDKPIIAISKPVYNQNNEFLGVVACDISMEKIVEIVEEAKGKGLRLFLFNRWYWQHPSPSKLPV